MDSSSVPVLKLMQLQVTRREADQKKKPIERNTAMAFEDKRSIRQRDERETKKILVVTAFPDAWKDWQ
eukprot:3420063-Karenia_brevis.AAC.1